MNGKLIEQPLAELIREISAHRLTGALRLQHEAVKTVIYFEGGALVYAAANLREFRLGEFLTKRGIVSEERFAALGNNLSDLAVAAALSNSGTMDRGRVTHFLTQQVTELVRVVLLWPKGTWNFEQRARLSDPVRLRSISQVFCCRLRASYRRRSSHRACTIPRS